MRDAHDQQVADHEYGGGRIIHHIQVVEIEQAEDLAARHGGQAVFRVGEWHLERREVNHLRHRERNHREVKTLPPDRNDAEQEPERCRGRSP